MKQSLFALLALCAVLPLAAETLTLPAPRKTGGMPLAEALNARRTERKFPDAVNPTPQQLADLLWAANGVTRPDGKRTAPSARNCQEIELAVATADGVFTYDAKANTLTRVETDDTLDTLRGDASVYLILYYDRDAQKRESAVVDAGFVGQNVYLWCASEGWGTVFLGTVDRRRVAAVLGCGEDEVLYAQKIGIR